MSEDTIQDPAERAQDQGGGRGDVPPDPFDTGDAMARKVATGRLLEELAADQDAQARIRARTTAQLEALSPRAPVQRTFRGSVDLSPRFSVEFQTVCGAIPIAIAPDVGAYGVRVVDERSGAMVTVQLEATFEGGFRISVDPDLKRSNRVRLVDLSSNMLQISLGAVGEATFGLYPDDEP